MLRHSGSILKSCLKPKFIRPVKCPHAVTSTSACLAPSLFSCERKNFINIKNPNIVNKEEIKQIVEEALSGTENLPGEKEVERAVDELLKQDAHSFLSKAASLISQPNTKVTWQSSDYKFLTMLECLCNSFSIKLSVFQNSIFDKFARQIVRRLGFPPTEAGVSELLKKLGNEVSMHGYKFPKMFPSIFAPFAPEVMQAVNNIKSRLDSNISKLAESDIFVDLTNIPAFAIDNPSTIFSDDAVSLHDAGDTYIVFTHIINPTFFIPPGSELEKAAKHKMEALYLNGDVSFMLPTELLQVLSFSTQRQNFCLTLAFEVPKKDVESQHPGLNILSMEVMLSKIDKVEKLSYSKADTLMETNTHPKKQQILSTLRNISDKLDLDVETDSNAVSSSAIAKLMTFTNIYLMEYLKLKLPDIYQIVNSKFSSPLRRYGDLIAVHFITDYLTAEKHGTPFHSPYNYVDLLTSAKCVTLGTAVKEIIHYVKLKQDFERDRSSCKVRARVVAFGDNVAKVELIDYDDLELTIKIPKETALPNLKIGRAVLIHVKKVDLKEHEVDAAFVPPAHKPHHP